MSTIIELTTAKSIVNIILKGSSKVEINWGDGKSEVYKLSDEACKINHIYTTRAIAYKILITGEDISYLFCNDNELTNLTSKTDTISLPIKNELTNLTSKTDTISLPIKSTALTLSCGNNKLTNLNVAGLTNLISLDCRNNQLSAKALDMLFDSLPTLSLISKIAGQLFIEDNPGVVNCNIEIATKKGWTVDYKPEKVLSLVTAKDNVHFVLEGSGPVLVNWADGISEPYKLPAKCSHNYAHCIHPIDELHLTDELASMNKFMIHNISVTRVSRTFNVTYVNCNDNQLISLEIDANQLYSITSLSCSDNQLTSLNIAGLANLIELDCRNNQLSAKALDMLFVSLPKVSPKGPFGKLFIKGNLGVEMCNTQIATEKGWIVDYKPKKMSLVTVGENARFVWGGSGSVLVSWGDGTHSIYRSPDYMCTHHYDSLGEHTITIIGNTITSLDCSYSELKSLDVSKNITLEELWCIGNQLTSLEVNRNINLKTLECVKNKITALDISRLTKLTTLKCGYNLLPFLDVSNNLALEILSCGGNRLSHLVVCGFVNLHTLSCENNSLTQLYCHNNQLTILDFSENPELETLHCGGNKLTNLDVRGLIKLRFLNCGNNNLTRIMMMSPGNKDADIPMPALEQLYCYGNKFTSLTIAGFGNLKVLNCADNPLTYLHCGHNYDVDDKNSGLMHLDISNNTLLNKLVCCCNKLTSLDVSDCENLVYIQAHGNAIKSLDISKLTKLVYLSCTHNQLTSLDVSNNLELEGLRCHANPLTSIDVSRLKKLKDLTSTGIPLDLSENTALEHLFCPYYPLTSLDVSKNTALTWLECYNSNLLTELDVSNNKKIRYINCTGCNLIKNEMGINAVDKLFETLPILGKDEEGTINVAVNNGVPSCNPNIATEKGWTVIGIP